MSQHYIDAVKPSHTVMVGYDRPLDDFFATVYENGDVIEWIPDEPTPKALALKLKPYAVIDKNLLETLTNEQLNRHAHPMMKIVDHRTGPKTGTSASS